LAVTTTLIGLYDNCERVSEAMPNTDPVERLIVTALVLVVIALLAFGLTEATHSIHFKLEQTLDQLK
jgi:hypothetical protein